jgi:hypothetical protein
MVRHQMVEAAGRRSFALDSSFEVTTYEAKPKVLRPGRATGVTIKAAKENSNPFHP